MAEHCCEDFRIELVDQDLVIDRGNVCKGDGPAWVILLDRGMSALISHCPFCGAELIRTSFPDPPDLDAHEEES